MKDLKLNFNIRVQDNIEPYEFKIALNCAVLNLPEYCVDILKYLYNIKEEKSIAEICNMFAIKYKTSAKTIQRKLHTLYDYNILYKENKHDDYGNFFTLYSINKNIINNDNDFTCIYPYYKTSKIEYREESKVEREERLINIITNHKSRGVNNAAVPIIKYKRKDKKKLITLVIDDNLKNIKS